MFVYDKYGIVNLSSFESPFRSSCACTNVCCGFILLGPDEPGNLTVVLDQKSMDLLACPDHQCAGGEEKDDPTQDGVELTHV